MSTSLATRPTRTLVAVVVMASLILGIAVFLTRGDTGTVPGDTDMFYAPVAVNLLHGEGYVLEHEFTDRYPPAFPLFLAAVFRVSGTTDTTNELYRWLVLAMQSLTVACVFLAAREWLTPRQSLLAAALLAVNPVFGALGATRYAWNATPLFLLGFFFSFWLILCGVRTERAWVLAVAGLARGISVLVWPAPSWLWIVDVVFIVRSPHSQPLGRSIQRALIYLCGIGLTVAPWLWAVHAHTGHVAMSSGLYPSMIHGMQTPLPDAARQDAVASFPERAERAQLAGALPTTGRIIEFYLREAVARPAATLSFIGHKAARAWFASIGGAYDRAVFWSQVPFWLLGLYGAVLAWKRHRGMAWLIFAMVAYFWIVSVAVLSTVRYMMPALGLLAMVAALAVDDLIARFERRAT